MFASNWLGLSQLVFFCNNMPTGKMYEIAFELDDLDKVKYVKLQVPSSEMPGYVQMTQNIPQVRMKALMTALDRDKFMQSNAAAIELACRTFKLLVPTELTAIMQKHKIKLLKKYNGNTLLTWGIFFSSNVEALLYKTV